MKIIARFLFSNEEFYLVVGDIDKYQKMVYKTADNMTLEYAKYDYLYKFVEYLYTKLKGLKLINFDLNEVPNSGNYIVNDISIDCTMNGQLFMPKKLVNTISYILNLGNYLNLEKVDNKNILEHIPQHIGSTSRVLQQNGNSNMKECNPNDINNTLINFNMKIPFNLVHGQVCLQSQEIDNLEVGDLILFDESYAPDCCRARVGNVSVNFRLHNNTLIFQENR